MSFVEDDDLRVDFRYMQPEGRLGQRHDTLGSFRKAANYIPLRQKEYSLIVVTDTDRRRILIGEKHRGFGQGMFNSFGGKREANETPADSAKRELEEETGISLPLQYVQDSKVGQLFFTFADSETEMIVYLFRVHVSCVASTSHITVDPFAIRGCDEITPIWVEDWRELPFHNMFADDSVWLTRLLSSSADLLLDGYFHFAEGGQDTNTILHCFLDIRPKTGIIVELDSRKRPLSLEKRLFHELHKRGINNPSTKEFNEAYAFVSATRIKQRIDIVIDVAGGHGALAALYLITTSAQKAVVIDPADVGNGSVAKAWNEYLKGKELRHRYECLRTGLPAELNAALQLTRRDRILVVACHACQHLSDEILKIGCKYGVSIAVMPCCQKDRSPGSSWKATSKNLDIPVTHVMDLLLAGKAMSWNVGRLSDVQYDVRMKLISHDITPQNRLIICRALVGNERGRLTLDEKTDLAHKNLSHAYRRAHANGDMQSSNRGQAKGKLQWIDFNLTHVVMGFALGVMSTYAFVRMRGKT